MAGSIKPTVYLIKAGVTDPDQIFKDANLLKKASDHGFAVYYKDSVPQPPKWLPFLASHFKVEEKSFANSSAHAVIVAKVNERYLAVPLGMGVHLLNMAKIEYNFGLKVAINCIPEDELRQMDLTTPEASSQKTKKQAVKSSTPEEFGVNKQKDILRGVAGKLPKGHALGERIEGKDCVRLTKRITTPEGLQQLCAELLSCAASEEYKQHFPWIDNMAIISDPVLISELFEDLLAAIKSSSLDNMHVSTPRYVENFYDYEGYVFTGNRKRTKGKDVYHFPTMADVIADLGEECIAALDREALSKSCKVHLKDADDNLEFGWPLSRCIVWETEKLGSKYLLCEGLWYRVEASFYGQVGDFFTARVRDLGLPAYDETFKRESEYNAHVCDTVEGAYLFDLGHAKARKKYIAAQNEVCDIFHGANKAFIHVKVGKSSSDISHLFRQGVFSARTLKSDPQALEAFRQHLRDYGCPEDMIHMPYTPSNYKVVFAVVLNEKHAKDIPFFSKVVSGMPRNFTLEMMGYECQFCFITHDKPKAALIPEEKALAA